MNNPTCPQCQQPLELLTGFSDATGMSIVLECLKGHRVMIEVPASRFVEVLALLGKKLGTSGTYNLPRYRL